MIGGVCKLLTKEVDKGRLRDSLNEIYRPIMTTHVIHGSIYRSNNVKRNVSWMHFSPQWMFQFISTKRMPVWVNWIDHFRQLCSFLLILYELRVRELRIMANKWNTQHCIRNKLTNALAIVICLSITSVAAINYNSPPLWTTSTPETSTGRHIDHQTEHTSLRDSIRNAFSSGKWTERLSIDPFIVLMVFNILYWQIEWNCVEINWNFKKFIKTIVEFTFSIFVENINCQLCKVRQQSKCV